jgi:hypothetical protein
VAAEDAPNVVILANQSEECPEGFIDVCEVDYALNQYMVVYVAEDDISAICCLFQTGSESQNGSELGIEAHDANANLLRSESLFEDQVITSENSSNQIIKPGQQ